MGTVVAPPAGRVVHFLQRTMWSYSSSLWAYHRNAAGHLPPQRLLDRAVHKRTFVRLICSGDVNPVRRIVNGVPRAAGKMYWSRRAKKLHNDLTQAGVTLNDADTRSGFARVRTLAALTTNRASHRYQAAGFSLTSGFFTQPLFDQPRSRGTRLLAALRMDGLWTARTALRIQGLLVHHPFNLRDCILCNENIADVRTFAHLVIDCVSLARIRRDAELEPFIVMARRRLGTPAALEDIYIWLLGGATPAGLRLNDWLRTFVRLICSGDVNPVRRIVNGVPRVVGKMYWSRRAKKLHNDLTQAGVTLNDADTRSGFARVRTLAALTTNRASHRYQAAGFSLTSGFFTQPLFDQPRSRGTRLLAALRMDGLWTARTALRIPGLLVNHPFNLRDCILCNESIADVRTFAHLVIDCVSLARIRHEAELEPFIVLARQCLGTQAALEDIYIWLLGGATPAGLRLNDWLVGRAGQLGDRGIRPLAARLADFLGAAYTLYQAQLWQYHRARHAAVQG
ncbi:hypothetical protein HK105_205365 [Polyrhizophydium stewartii]|uniref:Reverse transcriptase n=1 Tax=Polyrhizophydium stewartii TaxID=2732419 RepID=A0ABR4N6E3_9FUNG